MLRVLEVTRSRRRGSEATVVDEGGQVDRAWFWWYQAKQGEMVVCDSMESVDGRVEIGSDKRRGVIDRVPRDIVERYRRANRS